MPLPADVRAAAEIVLAEFCRSQSPRTLADRLRYEYAFVAHTALLIERRPHFMNPAEWTSLTVAKFRYTVSKGVWTLYWADRNEKWRRLLGVDASPSVDALIAEVIADPFRVFWG
jgi:hypothetical protein